MNDVLFEMLWTGVRLPPPPLTFLILKTIYNQEVITMKKSELIKIIKQEVSAVLSEQSATFRIGLQQKSDIMRNQQDVEFLRSIPLKTKLELYTLISSLEDRKDIDAKRQLKLIKDGFPYSLKDGQVASLVDLNLAFGDLKQ